MVMHRWHVGVAALGLAGCMGMRASAAEAGGTLAADELVRQMEELADAQLHSLNTKAPTDWVAGPMWAGVAELAKVSKKGEYRTAIEEMGKKAGWKILERAKDPFHADDFCIGQTYLEVYAWNKDPGVIEPLKARLDQLVDHLNTADESKKLTWWWCDSLFMAPAVLTRASVATGDMKYIQAMDKEWWRTAGQLYDRDAHLFYRDERFVKMKTKNGKKVFWARGNGWVMGGLARVLTYMPGDFPTRPKYVTMFKEMSAALTEAQGEDGTWRTSLLDAAEHPNSETSGTSFYCYAMAWGIKAGLLEREKYLPAAARAWAGLLAARRPDGVMGYVQKIGDRPGVATPKDTQLYATGSFLLAGCELMKLTPIAVPRIPPLTATEVTGTTATTAK